MYNKTMMIVVSSLVILITAASITYHFMHDRSKVVPKISPQVAVVTMGGQQFNVDVAKTMAEQNQGLSGRTGLGEHDGMLFIFSIPGIQFFWMKDMNFSIDIIWTRGGKIVGFQQNAPTPTALGVTSTLKLPIYMSPGLVDNVIEVSSGEVAKLGLKVGDAVQINFGSK